MNQKKVYMDYAATTPVDQDVLQDMLPYFSEHFGNSSSIHSFGEDAQKGVSEARQQVSDFLGSSPTEIIFTSGATEGNNMVIKGIAVSKKIREEYGNKPHIIISEIEHSCVIESVKRIVKDGLAEVSFIPVDKNGIVSIETIKNLIRPETALISVMYANNEVGTIQPIAEIGALVTELNTVKKKKIFFHTDAAQAINYLDCNVGNLGVDMLTISAHKIYGPKGVGALYIKKGTPLARLIDGGGQELKLRAGTLNVTGIVGLGSAISKIKEHAVKNEDVKKLRNKLIDGILSSISRSSLNGDKEYRLPNNANISFEGAEGEAILIMLNQQGVSVSTGSACAAENLTPSHVLKAMGITDFGAHSTIRFSLGRQTTTEEVNYVVSIMPGIIEKLRKVSGSLR